MSRPCGQPHDLYTRIGIGKEMFTFAFRLSNNEQRSISNYAGFYEHGILVHSSLKVINTYRKTRAIFLMPQLKYKTLAPPPRRLGWTN